MTTAHTETTDDTERLLIKASGKWPKLLYVAIGFFATLAFCYFFVKHPIMLLFFIGLYFLVVSVFYLHAWIDNTSYLELTPEGFCFKYGFHKNFYRWRDIEGVFTIGTIHITGFTKTMAMFNKVPGQQSFLDNWVGYGGNIFVHQLEKEPQEIVSLLNQWKSQYAPNDKPLSSYKRPKVNMLFFVLLTVLVILAISVGDSLLSKNKTMSETEFLERLGAEMLDKEMALIKPDTLILYQKHSAQIVSPELAILRSVYELEGDEDLFYRYFQFHSEGNRWIFDTEIIPEVDEANLTEEQKALGCYLEGYLRCPKTAKLESKFEQ